VGIFVWLEQTWLADWVRVSVLGYPLMITCHAIGMAVMVGLASVVGLRLLGAFRSLPYSALDRFFAIAWLGFGVNLLSGIGLFASQATSYAVNGVFLTKLAFVFLGAIAVAYLQAAAVRSPVADAAPPSASVRAVAAASLIFWTGAIVMGRLTAYL